MSSPRKKKVNDPVNEPRIVPTTSHTFSYGETPAAVSRQHFQDIAQSLGVTLEELASDVLKSSTEDQLSLLADFYKTKYNQEAGAIYNSILQDLNNSKSLKSRVPAASNKSKGKRKLVAVPVTKKNDQINNPKIDEGCSSKSTEETLVPQISSSSQQNPSQENKEPPVCLQEQDQHGESSSATVESNLPPAPNSTGIDNLNKEGTENDAGNDIGEMEDDFETFLYGKSPKRPKPSPKKKKKQNLPPTRYEDEAESSCGTNRQFTVPGLTLETSSPSRQRDLLSVARDIAQLQRSIAAGERIQTNVSDAVSFTTTNQPS